MQGAGFNAQQLAVVSGLFEWRDFIARIEDESSGYMLPNKSLLEIAKQMPMTTNSLRLLVNSRHPYVEQSLENIVNIIRHSIQSAVAFEETAQLLNKGHDIATIEEAYPVTNNMLSNCHNFGQSHVSHLNSWGSAYRDVRQFHLAPVGSNLFRKEFRLAIQVVLIIF